MKILGKACKKPIRVVIVGEADEAYAKLSDLVGKEVKDGVKSSEHQSLLRGIENVMELLKENVHYGKQVPKKQIPTKYVDLYEVSNIWRVDLPQYWRLIYTIRSTEIEVINLILDIHDHPTYDKIFNYKKR